MPLILGQSISHGHCINGVQSRTYRAWNSMMTRCTNPKNNRYHRYGGRGITVCERWKKFSNFLEDMGCCPSNLTLDRKDGDKGYYKDNCRWATWEEQDKTNRKNTKTFYTSTGQRVEEKSFTT